MELVLRNCNIYKTFVRETEEICLKTGGNEQVIREGQWVLGNDGVLSLIHFHVKNVLPQISLYVFLQSQFCNRLESLHQSLYSPSSANYDSNTIILLVFQIL